MQCQSETNWGLVMVLLGLIALMCVLAASAQTDSVYDLGIDGEVVNKCYSQPGSQLVLINPNNGECLKIMNWFLEHGFKHTGEIVSSEYNYYPGNGGYETQTGSLVLTK